VLLFGSAVSASTPVTVATIASASATTLTAGLSTVDTFTLLGMKPLASSDIDVAEGCLRVFSLFSGRRGCEPASFSDVVDEAKEFPLRPPGVWGPFELIVDPSPLLLFSIYVHTRKDDYSQHQTKYSSAPYRTAFGMLNFGL
jgi:hypothetical protein